MEKNNILSNLEKYSPWIGINRRLAGPILVINVIYILFYLVITFIFLGVGFRMTDIQQMVYYAGFGLFIVAVYLAFTGFLLRSIK